MKCLQQGTEDLLRAVGMYAGWTEVMVTRRGKLTAHAFNCTQKMDGFMAYKLYLNKVISHPSPKS